METIFELVRVFLTGGLEALVGSAFWQAIVSEWTLLMATNAPLLMAVSAFCGAMIGLEREHAHKPAGLRTNMMICLGSTLFTLASIHSWQHIAGGPATVDPGRIAAQIVSGVGFIGAGVILKTKVGDIIGITTASTIWLVAAIGMVIGLGLPLFGVLVSIIATFLLFLLGGIELHFPRDH